MLASACHVVLGVVLRVLETMFASFVSLRLDTLSGMVFLACRSACFICRQIFLFTYQCCSRASSQVEPVAFLHFFFFHGISLFRRQKCTGNLNRFKINFTTVVCRLGERIADSEALFFSYKVIHINVHRAFECAAWQPLCFAD